MLIGIWEVQIHLKSFNLKTKTDAEIGEGASASGPPRTPLIAAMVATEAGHRTDTDSMSG